MSSLKVNTDPSKKGGQKLHTFAVRTLGCKVNTYESDAFSEQLRKLGYEQRDFSEKSDIYIINTCTVTNIADKKSRQMLHRARRLNPDALIIATGCYVDAAMQNDSMKGLLSDGSVDLFVANKDKEHIATIADEGLREKLKEAELSKPCGALEGKDGLLGGISGHTRAFIKIQDGCNQFCSYCIIPYVRGRIRSRDTDEIVEEVERLSQSGVTEIVLSGIHISSYGKDISKGNGQSFDGALEGKDAPLLKLLGRLNTVDGIKRIRLGSLEPRLMQEAFVEGLRGIDKLCPAFHLALQSGSDSVLKRMNRHYTTKDYEKRCDLLRQYYDEPSITTDVIVGFPGETEEEFSETIDFVRHMRLYEANVFKFSRRAGTAADRMPGQSPDAVKNERCARLGKLAKELSHEYRLSFIGKELSLLSEEQIELRGESYTVGYSREYIKCAVKSDVPERNIIISGTAKEIFNEKGIDEYLLLS